MNVIVLSLQFFTLIYKKGWKEKLGNYRPVCLMSVLEKVMEQIILSTVMQDNQMISPGQHRFVKNKSSLTSLIFYGMVTYLVNKENVFGICLSGL